MASHTRQLMTWGMLTLLCVSGCSAPAPQPPAASQSKTGQATASPSAPSSAVPTDASNTSTPSTAPTTQTPGSESPSVHAQAEALADLLNQREQAASLVMAGIAATGASAAQIDHLKDQGISNIFLRGRSQLSVKQTAVKVKAVTTELDGNVPGNLPVWVATDQEGGFVRVLQGPGFSELPTAIEQGRWSADKLATRANAVGRELADAGVNVNLAPVADVVPKELGTSNAPIGYFARQYADNAKDVSAAILTVNRALVDAGVQPVVKHFPGLGRVVQNTDTSSSVTDTHIGAESNDLEPFKRAIEQGQSWVMISNARYTQIDATNDAPFSTKLITGLLRDKLGYTGVVISDDLCEAKQVAGVPVGERAVKFVAAGGTVPLCVNPEQAITMAKALAAEAKSDPAFAATVREAAVLILQEKLKQSRG